MKLSIDIFKMVLKQRRFKYCLHLIITTSKLIIVLLCKIDTKWYSIIIYCMHIVSIQINSRIGRISRNNNNNNIMFVKSILTY